MESATGKPGHTVKCHRCGRVLRAEASKRRLYGRGCWTLMRAAAIAAAVKGFAQRQVDAALELISDGGLVATSRPGVFRAVSSDGERTYLAHSETCTCPSGLKRLLACTCKHSLGVRIIMATGKA